MYNSINVNCLLSHHKKQKKLFLRTSMIVIGKWETRRVATDEDRQFSVNRDASSRWPRLSNC